MDRETERDLCMCAYIYIDNYKHMYYPNVLIFALKMSIFETTYSWLAAEDCRLRHPLHLSKYAAGQADPPWSHLIQSSPDEQSFQRTFQRIGFNVGFKPWLHGGDFMGSRRTSVQNPNLNAHLWHLSFKAWLKDLDPSARRGSDKAMAKQERYQLLEAAIYNLENMNNGRSQSQLLGMRKAASRDGGREVHVKVHKGWQVMDVHVQSHV